MALKVPEDTGVQAPDTQAQSKVNNQTPSQGFGNIQLGGELGQKYSWSERWKQDQSLVNRIKDNQRGSVGWDNGKPSYMPAGQPEIPRLASGDLENPWDTDPLYYQKAKFGKDGQPLPERAKGFTPQGTPDYGTGWSAWWDKMADNYGQLQKDVKEIKEDDTRKGYERFRDISDLRITNGFKRIGMGMEWAFSPIAKGTEQVITGTKITADELAEYSNLQDITGNNQARRREDQVTGEQLNKVFGGLGETGSTTMTQYGQTVQMSGQSSDPVSFTPGPKGEALYDFVESVEGTKWDLVRALNGAMNAMGQGTTIKDIWGMYKENLQLGRMGYSIGSNDANLKQEFRTRVLAGEDARLVAMDLENPISEMIGQIVFDPLNLLDLYTKGGMTAIRMGDALQESTRHVDEVAAVIGDIAAVGNKTNDWTQAQRAAKAAESVTAVRDGMVRIGSGIEKIRDSKGLFYRVGAAKRSVAYQRVGLFSSHVVQQLKNPNDVVKAFENMAMLTSKNDDDVAKAIMWLSSRMDTNVVFSESGLEFAHFAGKMLDDGEGALDLQKMMSGTQEFIDNGDVVGLGKHLLDKIDKTTAEMFPTIDELIKGESLIADNKKVTQAVADFWENGGKIRTIDRLINRGLNQGKLGKLQKAFSGRAYVGMRLDVAARGLMFDTVQSMIDLGPGVHAYSPEKWADISNTWLQFEHLGLYKGMSKADIVSLEADAKLLQEAGIFDVITGKGIVEGSALEKIFEGTTNAGGRLLQYFEIKNSQKIIGRSVDQAMRHLIKKTMPAIDAMVDAGLPPEIAKTLTSSLIGNYGDVASVQKLLLKELDSGFVNTFKHLDTWLPPEVNKVLDNFYILDEVEKITREASSLDDFVERVNGLFDDLIGLTDQVEGQHAEFVSEPMDPASDMGTALGGMEAAHTDGVVSISDFGEMKNSVQANKNTIEQVRGAIDGFHEQLRRQIYANPDFSDAQKVEKLKEMDDVFAQFDYPLSSWDALIGQSGAHMDRAWELTDAINKGTSTLGEFKVQMLEAFPFLDAATVNKISRSRTKLRDYMWRAIKQNYKQAFSSERMLAVEKMIGSVDQASPGLLQEIQKLFPDQDLFRHPLIDSLVRAEITARQMDSAVMVNNKMKPLGGMIKWWKENGQVANANRGVAAIFDNKISPTANVLEEDLYIMSVVNRTPGGENFANLADVPPEFVFDAFKAKREAEGFKTGLEKLDDVMGYGTPAHDAFRPASRIPQTAANKLDGVKNRIIEGIYPKPTKEGYETYYHVVKTEGDIPSIQLTGLEPRSQEGVVWATKDPTNWGDGGTLIAFQARPEDVVSGLSDETVVAFNNTVQVEDILRIYSPENIGGDAYREDIALKLFAENLDHKDASTLFPQKYQDLVTIGKADDVIDSISGNKNPYFLTITPGEPITVFDPVSGLDIGTIDEIVPYRDGFRPAVIRVPEEGRNEGSFKKILGLLKKEADKAGVPMYVVPGAVGDTPAGSTDELLDLLRGPIVEQAGDKRQLSTAELTEKYSKYGFEEGNGYYVYNPNSLDNSVSSYYPPVDDAADQIFARDVLENQAALEAARETIIAEAKNNWGAGHYIDEATKQKLPQLKTELDNWFTQASTRMDGNRLAASKYGMAMRDFILHNYDDRFGIDALMSMGLNFHFWPSRTMAKWGKRIPENIGLINNYMIYQDSMEKLHSDMPEWYQQSLNPLEMLGMQGGNPLMINLMNVVNPFQNMMGGFDNPDKRVDWWSTMVDSVGSLGMGFPTPIIQMGTALYLSAKGEEEAAALHGGRIIPITKQIKGATSLLGVNEGRGVELDPAVRVFSDAGAVDFSGRHLDPYEEGRVANALSMIALERGLSEQAIDDAWNHGGELWDEAIARSNQKDAVGALFTSITGMPAKYRTVDDIKIDKFWKEYGYIVAMRQSQEPEKFKEAMDQVFNKYPFAEYMILARKGGEERDKAYAYIVLSRISPGDTAEVARAAGFDYDIVSDFYDNKGRFEDMNVKDKTAFMTFIAELGTTLAMPDSSTRAEWNYASAQYKEMVKLGEEYFGKGIWDLVDKGYQLKPSGLDQSSQWNEFLRANPIVEEIMEWRDKYVLEDPVLSAYYGGQEKLRSYWKGQMYEQLEQEFTVGIWDVIDEYDVLVRTGQTDEAKAYKREHPEITAFNKRKKELNDNISEAMIKYGNMLPVGQSTRLRDDLPAELSVREAKLVDAIRNGQPVNYTEKEFRSLLGEDLMESIIRAANGEYLQPEDIQKIVNKAQELGVTAEMLVKSVEESGY